METGSVSPIFVSFIVNPPFLATLTSILSAAVTLIFSTAMSVLSLSSSPSYQICARYSSCSPTYSAKSICSVRAVSFVFPAMYQVSPLLRARVTYSPTSPLIKRVSSHAAGRSSKSPRRSSLKYVVSLSAIHGIPASISTGIVSWLPIVLSVLPIGSPVYLLGRSTRGV